MGAGGVVQNHSVILDRALTDPAVYDCLPAHHKDAVDIIRAKPLLERTQDDVNRQLVILTGACAG